MGLFDKFKKPKEPPRQQRSGVMELIFCPAESLEHIMGRMESALGVHSPGTGNRISIYQDDMHIDFTGFVADKETEDGKKAQEQLQGVWAYFRQVETEHIDIQRNLLYHLRQCQGMVSVNAVYDGPQNADKEGAISERMGVVTAALQGVLTWGMDALVDPAGKIILSKDGKSDLEYYMPSEVPIPADWAKDAPLVIYGTTTTGPCVAVSAETYADRIFQLTPSASSPDVVAGKDNVFQMCFVDPNQGSASAQYIKDNNLGSAIAVIYKNDDVYSTGIYNSFVAKAGELGLNIVSTTTFTTDSKTDFSVQLNDAKNSSADLIYLPTYYDANALILTQANAMGYAPKYFGVDGMDGILSVKGFDTSLAEGVMLLTPFNADADDEATKSFVAKYQEKFGEVPNQFAADAYDCVYAIYNALKDEDVTSGTSAGDLCDILIGKFTSMTFNGLTGEGMTWADTGAVSKTPKGMYIENGAYVGMD